MCGLPEDDWDRVLATVLTAIELEIEMTVRAGPGTVVAWHFSLRVAPAAEQTVPTVMITAQH